MSYELESLTEKYYVSTIEFMQVIRKKITICFFLLFAFSLLVALVIIGRSGGEDHSNRHRVIPPVVTGDAAHTYSLYKGATGGSAAGTEIVKNHSIAANKEHDIFFSPGKKMLATDFLSAIADVTAVP